jgi:hypothetical protein
MQPSPVKFTLEYPEKLSRLILVLRTLFGWIYVLIPHGIILGLYSIALFFTTIIAWFAILFTGKYPRGLFDFAVGYQRWNNRVNAYMLLMTDSYPPFSGRE